jgi:hypothetical protein
MSSSSLQRVLLLVLAVSPSAQAWVTPSVSGGGRPTSVAAASRLAKQQSRVILSAGDQWDDDQVDTDSTSFAKADQSLMEEADKKRMDEMGDFDVNADVRYYIA